MKEIVTKKGTAIGNMRFDSIKVRSDWKNEPTAKEARQRLIDGEAMGEAVEDQQKQISDKYGTGGSLTASGRKYLDCPMDSDKHGTGGSLTDTLVKELGGGKMAENQTNACKNLINNIKAGGGTGELDGDLAAAARKRMIDRQGSNGDTENGGHPDMGKDRANRRAYPKESRSRKDTAEELSGSFAAAARKRMIDRQGSNGGHPNTRKDGVNKSPRNYAEARESARAWANAGSR